jgi:hypothetical protein
MLGANYQALGDQRLPVPIHPEPMEQIAPREIDYRGKEFTALKYNYQRLIQQTGGQTVTVSSSGGQESVFEIPSVVFNPARSYIQFTAYFQESATAGQRTWIPANLLPFWQQVQFLPRGGIPLVDLNNAQNYTQMIMAREKKFSDLKTAWDTNTAGATAATATGFGTGTRISNTVNIVNYRLNNTTSSIAFDEFLYHYIGAAAAGAAGDLYINFKIPLSMFENTLLSADKDVYFGGMVTTLRLVWGAATKMAFTSSSATDATQGAAYPATNASAYNRSVAISNLSLLLAKEDNPIVQQNIIDQVMNKGGLSFYYPYVWHDKRPIGPSTNHSVTLRYNKMHGLRLKKIYISAYNGIEGQNLIYDRLNTPGATQKINSFYTQLDNNRLQQYNLSCLATDGDDWTLMQDGYKGSLILSSDMHYYNWLWEEDFGFERPPDEMPTSPPTDNLVCGLDLGIERRFDLQAVTPNNTYNWYSFAVTQRKLTIGPNAILVDAE